MKKLLILLLFIPSCNSQIPLDIEITDLILYQEVQSALDAWDIGLHITPKSNHKIIFTDSSCSKVEEPYKEVCQNLSVYEIAGFYSAVKIEKNIITRSFIVLYMDRIDNLQHVLIHEVGHSLGLRDMDNKNYIMFPHYTNNHLPSQIELNAVQHYYIHFSLTEEEKNLLPYKRDRGMDYEIIY